MKTKVWFSWSLSCWLQCSWGAKPQFLVRFSSWRSVDPPWYQNHVNEERTAHQNRSWIRRSWCPHPHNDIYSLLEWKHSLCLSFSYLVLISFLIMGPFIDCEISLAVGIVPHCCVLHQCSWYFRKRQCLVCPTAHLPWTRVHVHLPAPVTHVLLIQSQSSQEQVHSLGQTGLLTCRDALQSIWTALEHLMAHLCRGHGCLLVCLLWMLPNYTIMRVYNCHTSFFLIQQSSR